MHRFCEFKGIRATPRGPLRGLSYGRKRFAFELIDVAEDFGHGGVLLDGHGVIQLHLPVEDLGQLLPLDDRNVVLQRQAPDPRGLVLRDLRLFGGRAADAFHEVGHAQPTTTDLEASFRQSAPKV